ncbi:DNA-binding protein Alba [Candidatus Woesearchaeota archaeon]|nr:DNA-binding protein Alba [Candidatus Woesearchaeota archaeon]
MAEEAKETRPAAARKDDNIVYIGIKPTMTYVLAVMTQMSSGQKEVHIKARGRSISTAVDVAEAVKNKFLSDLKKEVSIGTEQVQDKQNRKLNVSTIDITLTK